LNRRTVLVVVYYFPPRGGVAVIRTVKYIKYLREFGWEPIILTAKQSHFQFRDDSLLNELPKDIRIIHTSPPWIQHLIRSAQSQMQDGGLKNRGSKNSSKKSSPIYLFLRNLKNRLNRLIFLIDDYEGWRKTAIKAAESLIQSTRIDLIYTSSPPHSVQLIGQALSKKHGIPWVADFRDPWTQDFRYFIPSTLVHKWAILKGERKTVEYASRIISVSDVMKHYFQNRYPSHSPNKFITITNGFDSNDYPADKNKTEFLDKFVITYAGSFYLHQTPVYFYQGIQQFLAENPGAKKDLLIQIIGKSQKDYEAYPFEIGIGENIRKTGFVPHREVGRYLANSDIYLLVLWSNPDCVDFAFSGKFFEYLAMEKPILALVNTGACYDFFQQYPVGETAPFSDVKKIAEAITLFYNEWKNGTLRQQADQKMLQLFDRKNLTGQLSHLFHEVVEESNT